MSGVEMSGGRPINPAQVEAILIEEATLSMNRAIGRTHAEVLSRAERHRRTGTFMRSIAHRVQRAGQMVIGMVGTNIFYAPYLEYGTGLYGPRHRWIVPIHAKALRFPQPGNPGFTLAGRQRKGKAGAGAAWVYAKRVRGIRPLRIFYDAGLVAAPFAEREFELGAERAALRIGELALRGA